MAINFPENPSLNQEFTSQGRTWVWTGSRWEVSLTNVVSQSQLDSLINSAPSTLDTLNELAAALGDDPSFSSTIISSINNLENEKQDNVIVNQGDLVLGGAGGSTDKLSIGEDDSVLHSDGATAFWKKSSVTGFDSMVEITSSNSSYPLPPLANSIVKFTIIGAGGGGTGVERENFPQDGPTGGSDGGDTSVTYGQTTIVAAGGEGANGLGGGQAGQNGNPATSSFVSSNWGNTAQYWDGGSIDQHGRPGMGGEIKVAYADLSGLTTIDITVGTGGAGGAAYFNGGDGGDGVVIMEYVSQ